MRGSPQPFKGVEKVCPVLPAELSQACGRDEGTVVTTLPCPMTDLGMGHGRERGWFGLGPEAGLVVVVIADFRIL